MEDDAAKQLAVITALSNLAPTNQPSSLGGVLGRDLVNLPGASANVLMGGINSLANLGAPEGQKPDAWQVPDVVTPPIVNDQSSGVEKIAHLITAGLAPQVAALAVPYAGASKIGELAGLGSKAAGLLGDVGAGVVSGADRGPTGIAQDVGMFAGTNLALSGLGKVIGALRKTPEVVPQGLGREVVTPTIIPDEIIPPRNRGALRLPVQSADVSGPVIDIPGRVAGPIDDPFANLQTGDPNANVIDDLNMDRLIQQRSVPQVHPTLIPRPVMMDRAPAPVPNPIVPVEEISNPKQIGLSDLQIQQNPAKSKIADLPEYRRTEGGSISQDLGLHGTLLLSGIGAAAGAAAGNYFGGDSTSTGIGAVAGALLPWAGAAGVAHLLHPNEAELSPLFKAAKERGIVAGPAYRLPNGEVISRPGARAHFELANELPNTVDPMKIERGFLNEHGDFLTPHEANAEALLNGQVDKKTFKQNAQTKTLGLQSEQIQKEDSFATPFNSEGGSVGGGGGKKLPVPEEKIGQGNSDATIEKNISDAKMMNPEHPEVFLRQMATVAHQKGNAEAAANFEAAIANLQKKSKLSFDFGAGIGSRLAEVQSITPQGQLKIGGMVVNPEKSNWNTIVSKAGLSKEEAKFLPSQYPDAFTRDDVNLKKLSALMKETPMLTHTELPYKPTNYKVSAAQESYDTYVSKIAQIKHEVETKFKGWKLISDNTVISPDNKQMSIRQALGPEPYGRSMPKEIERHAQKLLDLEQLKDQADEQLRFEEGAARAKPNPSASARYRQLNQYSPEVLKGEKPTPSGGKVLHVIDGVINIPKESVLQNTMEDGISDGIIHVSSEHHYPDPYNTNLLGWYRMVIEQHPDGRKIASLQELQSDWGGKIEQIERKAKRISSDGENIGSHWKKHLSEIDHPLARNWEAITLDRAAKTAKKYGADEIVLPDAPTAMITEGHDTSDQFRFSITDTPKNRKIINDYMSEAYDISKPKLGDNYFEIKNGKLVFDGDVGDGMSLRDLGIPEIEHNARPPQEEGMKYHYDEKGPKLLEKITKEKPEKINLGIHENAKANAGTLQKPGSPIFKDEKGQRKTYITGLSFKLKNVNERASSSIHTLLPIVGIAVGASAGYQKDGMEGAIAGAVLGGSLGILGGRALDRLHLTGPETTGVAAVKTVKSSVSAGLKSALDSPAKDLGGQDVYGRGGVIPKFFRAAEHLFNLGLPPELHSIITRARGFASEIIDHATTALKQAVKFNPPEEVVSITNKFLNGKLLDDAAFLKDNGAVTEEAFSKLSSTQKEELSSWTRIEKDAQGNDVARKYYVKPEARDQFLSLAEKNYLDSVPPEWHEFANLQITMRRSMNQFQKLIGDALPNGLLKDKILDSIGRYVPRMYRIFGDNKYHVTDSQIEAASVEFGLSKAKGEIDAAVAQKQARPAEEHNQLIAELSNKRDMQSQIRLERLSKFVPTQVEGNQYFASPEVAESLLKYGNEDYLKNEVKAYLSDIKSNRDAYGVAKGIDKTLFMEREDIGPAWRDMLGEYTDPTERMAMGLEKMYAPSQAARLISTVKDMEIDGLPISLSGDSWAAMNTKLKADGDIANLQKLNAYKKLASDIKYGEYSGLYVHRFLSDYFANDSRLWESSLGRSMASFNRIFKTAHVPLNPIAQLRQIFSMPIFALIGRASPASMGQAFDAWSGKIPDLKSELIREGIWTADFIRGELSGNISTIMNGRYDSSVVSKLKKGYEAILEGYRIPDMVTRGGAYIGAKNRIALELGKELSDPEVIARAVEWTDKYTMNYDNVSRAVRELRNIPFVNPFISFQAEILRIMKNMAVDASHGNIERLAALGAVVATPELLMKTAEQALGPKDQKEWEKMKAVLPPYYRDAYLLPIAKLQNGKFKFVSVGPIIPHDNFAQGVKAIAKGDGEAFWNVNPFLSSGNSPLFNLITEAVTGESRQTGLKYRDTREQLGSMVSEILPPLGPGGYEWNKLANVNVENLRSGKVENWGDIALRYTTGLSSGVLKPDAVMASAQGKLKSEIANLRSYYLQVAKTQSGNPEKDIEVKSKAYNQYRDSTLLLIHEFAQKFAN